MVRWILLSLSRPSYTYTRAHDRGEAHTSTIAYDCCDVVCIAHQCITLKCAWFCCILTQVRCIIRNIVRDWAAEVTIFVIFLWQWYTQILSFISYHNSQLKLLVVCSFYLQGQRERDQCYKPILEELDSLFPDRQKGRYTMLPLFATFESLTSHQCILR